MFLFNIKQSLEQWNLQWESECARKRDHSDLLQVSQSVQVELNTQGERIDEVLEMVRTLSQSPTFNASAHSRSQTPIVTHDSLGVGSPNARSSELQIDRVRLSKLQPATKRHVRGCEAKEVSKPPQTPRGSWMNKLGLQRISAVVGPLNATKGRMTGRSESACAKQPPISALSTPKCKPKRSKVPPRGLLHGAKASRSSPERGRQRVSSRSEASQATSSLAQPTCTSMNPPSSRSPSTSPCGSKYVEIRYCLGNVSSGVLLSGAFNSLGKTTIGELRLANSHPTHPGKLSRLNEGNFVMEIPGGIYPTDLLNITPWTNDQGPLSIVWILQSCGMHMEPVKVTTARGTHSEWAIVACTTNTSVQDVTDIIKKLTNREIAGCFRRDGQQTCRMENSRLLQDCGVRRAMYLEVVIIL